MTDGIRSIRGDFFGRDSVTAFIGQVEDVNDPKMGHRVKVRCVGWHPKDKEGDDGLATDDLPWARVGMPTTHAQSSRIGGKHGLLPGCWVFGFFMDGEEANDPFIISTFNFTPKASSRDLRETGSTQGGRVNDDTQGFSKVNNNEANSDETKTPEERQQAPGFGAEADISGDGNTMASDGTCGEGTPFKSVAETRRTEEDMKTTEAPDAQGYNIASGDGLCGSIPHARDDIRTKMEEQMPSQLSRFRYGDQVWNNFTGNHMDMNGIMAKLATEICNLLKSTINSSKAATNEENRTRHSVSIGIPDRVGFPTIQIDVQQQTQDDFFNGMFQTMLIDILCGILLGMLQAMNNGDERDDERNEGGEIGTEPNTPIFNVQAGCITDTILDNINTIVNDVTLTAQEAAEERSNNDEEDDTMSFISQILGGLSAVMQFPLTQKYSQRREVHNKAGDMSQAQATKETGCREERLYNTETGTMGSMMGFGGLGGFGGAAEGFQQNNGTTGDQPFDDTLGTTGRGSTGTSGRNRYLNVGFGGLNIDQITLTNDNRLCEEAGVIVLPDKSNEVIQIGDIVIPKLPEIFRPDNPCLDYIKDGVPVVTKPAGNRGEVISISVPSTEERCARNFVRGTPNQAVVKNSGERYFFNNHYRKDYSYPSVFIKGYRGNPVPVVDSNSGELVAILTNCNSWDPNQPGANVSIIPDNSAIGIRTDDPNYDIVLGGFFVANTGRGYCEPEIIIMDKDRNGINGVVRPVVVSGRIVDVEIINNGTGFRRIPRVIITDECGYGARIYPIMSVVAKPQAKPLPVPVQMIACPSKNQRNLY